MSRPASTSAPARSGSGEAMRFGPHWRPTTLPRSGRIKATYELAGEAFREALRDWRASGWQGGVAFATGNLGRLAARTGRHDEAEELLVDARDRFAELGDEMTALEMDTRRAENFVFAGRPADALAILEPAVAEAQRIGGWATLTTMIQRLRGDALMQLGRTEEARAAYDEALRVGREGQAEFEVALTLESLVAAGNASRAGDDRALHAPRDRSEGGGAVGAP